MTGRARVLTAALLLAWSAAAAGATDDLYGLLRERLALMPSVAAYKWHAGLPVEDADREQAVVADAVLEGLRVAMTLQSSQRLLEAQIAAAKDVQQHWFDAWRAGEPVAAAEDLALTLRPRLSDLSARIVAAAAAAGADHDRARFDRTLDLPGLTPARRDQLYAAVTGVETYPDRLAQVLGAGVVRVGTTGDYAPFSYRQGEGDVVGIDIDLARHLAAALDARVVLVPTSWPTLMDDLAAGHYDIAMSGVSRVLPRQRDGYLTPPYHVGGKTAIARCEDRDAFATLAEIDRPGVRVVVNPGGTNQRFVDAHVHRAEKIVHPDNRTIFAELVEGRADVMITDRIEVTLQTRRNPALCATMTGNLTYQEKAYLLPQDQRWLEFVSTWLSLALADGTVTAAFRAHGVAPTLPALPPPAE